MMLITLMYIKVALNSLLFTKEPIAIGVTIEAKQAMKLKHLARCPIHSFVAKRLPKSLLVEAKTLPKNASFRK